MRLRVSVAVFSFLLTIIALSALLPLSPLHPGAVDPPNAIRADNVDLEISRVEATSDYCPRFNLDFQHPLRILASPISAVTFKATISKVLVAVPDGAVPDTLGIGIRLQDGEGRSCWLICSVSPSSVPLQKQSGLLGEYFICGTTTGFSEVAKSTGEHVSATLELADFYPALLLAAQANRISIDIQSLVVCSVYPFSESVIRSEDAVIISARMQSGAKIAISSISIDGQLLSLAGDCGYARPSNNAHEVVVKGRVLSGAWFSSSSIEQTFQSIRF